MVLLLIGLYPDTELSTIVKTLVFGLDTCRNKSTSNFLAWLVMILLYSIALQSINAYQLTII